MTDLYFAYGSNLHDANRRAWCAKRGKPDFVEEEVGPAWLPDRRLIFDYHSSTRGGGALDLAPAVGHVVEGRLFRIPKGGWDWLDEKEGARSDGGGRYRRIGASVFDRWGRRVQAGTYEVTEAHREARFVEPLAEYVDLVRDGLLSAGLSPAPLEEAARDEVPRSLARGLFTYGTLLPGEPRYPWLTALDAGLGALRPASVAGRLFDVGVYPALVPASPEEVGRVHGVFAPVEQIDRLLPGLDEVEAFYGYDDRDSLYHRAPVRVQLEPDESVLAWTYLMPFPPRSSSLIPGGRWRTRAK